MNKETPSFEIKPKDERLDLLTRRDETRAHSKRYSSFIRSMRIILPLAALSVVAMVFSWNTLQEKDIAPAKPAEDQPAPRIGKNELLAPRFESIDEKNQPYTITATRALQDSEAETMLLDEPMADIILNNGNWLAMKSRQGAYRQQTQRLLLKDNVTLYHDAGYSVKTQELDVDLKAGTAQTDLAISGQGPLGTLDANGMHANQHEGTLILTGPAKLVIYDTGKDILSP